jgi:hypothetical protein
MATLQNASPEGLVIENSLLHANPLFPDFFSQALRKDIGGLLDQLSKDAAQATDLTALALGAKARSMLAAPISSDNTASLLLYMREANRALLSLNPGWQDSKKHLRAQELIAKGYEYAEGPVNKTAGQSNVDGSMASKSQNDNTKPVNLSPLNPEDVPEIVKERYLRNPANPGLFFFRDRKNNLAFSDTGIKLTTKHDDPVVADSMVAMAIGRGWGSIRVSGSDEFKKEVWLQAQLAGLLTIGYIPSDADYARLDAAKKYQAEKARKDVEKIAKADSKNERNGRSTKTANQSDNPSNRDTSEQSLSPAGERLVAHGAAPYEFDKRDGAKKSYFIKTEGQDGKERIYWGVGLQDALIHSGVKINDQLSLKRLGKEQVVTDKPIWDESGKLLGHEPITTERNAWEIKLANLGQPTHSVDSGAGQVDSIATESPSIGPTQSPQSLPANSNTLWAHKAKAFLNGDPKQVLGAFPELGKTLLAFKAAQSYFEKTVPNEEKRSEILTEIKQGLYARILSGNIPQVQIIDERKIGVLVDHGKTGDNSYFISYKDLFGKVQTLKDPGLEGAIKKTPLAIGQPIELSKNAISKSIPVSNQKADLLDIAQGTGSAWEIKGGDVAIYSQAISFGAVAKAKGANSKTVDLIVRAALIKGHKLAKNGVAIPMPTVFDPNAPAKPMVQTLNPEKTQKKPKIDRSQSIGR